MGLGLKVQDFGVRPRTEGGIDGSFSLVYVNSLSLSLALSLADTHTPWPGLSQGQRVIEN